MSDGDATGAKSLVPVPGLPVPGFKLPVPIGSESLSVPPRSRSGWSECLSESLRAGGGAEPEPSVSDRNKREAEGSNPSRLPAPFSPAATSPTCAPSSCPTLPLSPSSPPHSPCLSLLSTAPSSRRHSPKSEASAAPRATASPRPQCEPSPRSLCGGGGSGPASGERPGRKGLTGDSDRQSSSGPGPGSI